MVTLEVLRQNEWRQPQTADPVEGKGRIRGDWEFAQRARIPALLPYALSLPFPLQFI